MYKGFFDVRLEIEDRSDELLFLSDNIQEAQAFYDKKVQEMRDNPELEFSFIHGNSYLGDFMKGTTFMDKDSLTHDIRISNDMYYNDGILYHPDGNTEEMTEEEFQKTLENYRKG